MAMKKIKPQYGKVTAPNLNNVEEINGNTDDSMVEILENQVKHEIKHEQVVSQPKTRRKAEAKPNTNETKTEKNERAAKSKVISEPNPFLQTKEVFGKARLTKIGYRMRTDYVEILDIIKKIKKGGYTLEAVLDDALTFYFENSEVGKEAIKKAEIFYS